MAGQKFTLTFDAQLNVSQMKGALADIQKNLNNLNLPQNITKGLQDTFNKLSKEVQNFEVLTSKDLTGKVDTRKIENSANKISNLFKTLQIQVKDLSALSGKSLEKLFPDKAIKSITAGEDAIKQYERTIKQIDSTLTSATKKVQEWQDKLAGRTVQRDQQVKVVEDLKNQAKSVQEIASSQGIKQNIADYDVLKEAIKQAKQNIDDYNNAVANGDRKANQITEKGLQNVLNKLNATKEAYDQQAAAIRQAEGQLKNYENAVNSAKQKIAEYEAVLVRLNQASGQDKANALAKLFQDLNNARFDTSKYTKDLEGAKQAVNDFKQSVASGLTQSVQAASDALNNNSDIIERNTQDVRENTVAQDQLKARMNDVSALKSRIQYFFGLTNTINLFRQAIRGAYETIKELDKAMTETAVVTDFSVGDMWKQLPEYTKRANELGVTTKAAYEAATLYYQQGLTTQEVNELSVETLKMARIAGLDAAEATDRMTNALRGFNMELNNINAQRVDDVYSKLAAISASNVDEISTAMTKVASLAHNAGMEFETTAAFLAQIIETTRESAETAGTALKTVVARFTEVKKLVNEGELKGEDEEGELIDVNKVSQALRTAGIDLNRYFLGEVGIDDIFLELAEKWDDLTSLQQRYIATQAAGSRQQSRFIALLSDYARTQELVGAAYNANGAAAEQFGKTQESLESKLARLKNAWNEFLMGLTNNSVVKAGVDLLTNLLNTINKLTSAFGEGTGTVMKWALAIGTLRGMGSLFSKGGGLEKLLGSLTGGKGIVGGLGNGLSLGIGQALTGALKNGLSSLGTQAMAGALKTGSGGILGKVFGGAIGWGAAGLGASGSTAALIAGVSSAFTALAAAIGTAALAYQAWLKFTPEGQLKAAKKHATAMQEEAKQAQQTSNSLQDLQNNYQRYTDAVNNATTVTERQTAIQSRNDAILKAIEENPDYAQYLDTDFDVNGELILTLNEEKVTEAATEAAKEATRIAIESYFSQADVALKEAAVTAKRQEGHMEYYDWNAESYVEGDTSAATEMLRQNQLATAQSWAKTAYASMLQSAEDINLTSEIANGLSTMLSEIFMKTNGEQIEQVTVEAIARGIANGQIDEDIAKAFTAENFDFSMADFNPGNLEEFSELLGFNVEDLSDLDKAFKLEQGTIRKLITTRAAEIKEVQKNNRAKIFEEIMRSGVSVNKAMQDFIFALSPKKVEQALDLLMSGSGVLSEDLQKSLILDLPQIQDNQWQQLNALFNSINLDNPIQGFVKLNKQIADGPYYVRKYAAAIKSLYSDTFNKGNLFKSFISSEEYEDVAKSIDKILKKNAQLTPKDIEELAEESSSLNTFLEEDILSVQQLTKALNVLNDGAPISGLTDAVLDAFDATADLDDLIYELHETIANFNAGIDYGEGTDFVVDLADQLLEMTENYEFGNEQFKNIYDQLFGKGAYDAFMAQWGQRGIEEFTAEAQARIQRLKDWADEESYGFMLASANGLTGIEGISGGPEEFTWDVGTKTTEELQRYVSETLGVSLDTAMALIEGAMAHMPDLTLELKTNDYHAALDKMVSGTESSITVTQAELEALAAQYNKTTKEIEADLEQAATTAGKQITVPTIIDWTDATGSPLTDEALTKKFNENVNIDDALQDAINEASGNIDADKLLSNLTDMGLTPEQASQIAEKIASDLNAQFEKTVVHPKIEIDDENNIIVSEESITVTSGSLAALNTEAQTQLENAFNDAQYSLVAEHLAAQNYDGVRETLQKAIYTAAENGQGVLDSTLNNTSFGGVESSLYTSVYDGVVIAYNDAAAYIASQPIQVPVQTLDIPHTHALGAGASGGVVPSLAEGSDRFLQPGWALTGEEAPEIIWNKEQGYAYITGTNGPEFRNLQPGDRVFNAQQTSRILKNTSFAKGGYYDAYAKGRWNLEKINERRGKSSGRGSSGGSGSGSGSGSEPKTEEWISDFDWLYNLLEDIVELERSQKKLQEDQNKILELGNNSTGRDLYENLIKQLANLELQRQYQSTVQNYRRREMDEFMGINSEYSRYFRFNDRDQTLEIDWDAINNIGDKETYDKVKELVDEAEKIQDKMDDAEDSVRDVEKQIRELQNIWRDEYAEFEQRVLDALINSYQRVIDNYSDLHNTVTDSNNKILESIEREINLERQIRDNTKTENDIADAESRLAYLQRDTTGGNELAVLNAQKELEQSREAYEDTLIDQAVQHLQEDNQNAALQREEQINLMQAQLDYFVKSGEFNDDVSQLLHDAMGADGQLLTDSTLYQLLQQEESWSAMSDVDREIWEDELNNTFKSVSAYLLKEKSEADGTFATAIQTEIMNQGGTLDVSLQNGLYGIGMSIGSMSQAMEHVTQTYDDAVSGLREANGALANANSQLAGMAAENEALKSALTQQEQLQYDMQQDPDLKRIKGTGSNAVYGKKARGGWITYDTGGLNTQTGPAWLDGTSREPEYVLNAKQTDAFLRLAEVLPSMFNGNAITNNNLGGNVYVELTMNVSDISSDYDVDRFMDRVKSNIYDAASYRNVNAVNFQR